MAVRKTDIGNNRYYVTYYSFWSKILLMEAVPYCVILILNTIIVSKIFESIRFRHQFSVRKLRKEFSLHLTTKRNSNSPKHRNVENEGRRRSSPILRHQTSKDDGTKLRCLSSSNLNDDTESVIGNSNTKKSYHHSENIEMNNLSRVEAPKDMIVTFSSNSMSPKTRIEGL